MPRLLSDFFSQCDFTLLLLSCSRGWGGGHDDITTVALLAGDARTMFLVLPVLKIQHLHISI